MQQALRPVAGIDPTQHIAEWEKTERGIELSDAGAHTEAAVIFKSVLSNDPDNVLALKFLGCRRPATR